MYPCKPQFYYIKVRFKGVKIIKACFRDLFDSGHSVSLKIACAHSEDLRATQGDQSIRCLLEDALYPWLHTQYSAKTLTSLRGCAG